MTRARHKILGAPRGLARPGLRTRLATGLAMGLTCGLMACTPAATIPATPSLPPQAPPGAPDGTCWHRNISPAVIETVTDQVLVQPEQRDAQGKIISPAVFRTVTRQEIVQPRRVSWIETPCPAQITPGFIASLQRALAVRGYYQGAIHGRMDPETRIALRRFQKEAGLDSSALSLDTARQLGLVAVAQ